MTKEELAKAWNRRVQSEKTAKVLNRVGRRVRHTDTILNPKSPNETRRAAEALEGRRSTPVRSPSPSKPTPVPATHAKNLAANRAMLGVPNAKFDQIDYTGKIVPKPKGGVITKALSQPSVVKAFDAVGQGLTTAANSGAGRTVARFAGSTGGRVAAKVAAKVAGKFLLPVGAVMDTIAVYEATQAGANAFMAAKDAQHNELKMTEKYGSVAAATRTRHAKEAAKKKA
jgi:hypothetical protein